MQKISSNGNRLPLEINDQNGRLLLNNASSSAWGFYPESLRLRAKFLLLVQDLIDKVSESLRSSFNLESIEKEKLGLGESEGLLDKSEDLRDGSEGESCVRVLDKVLELGVNRLKPPVVVVVTSVDGDDESQVITEAALGGVSIEEGEMRCLRSVVWEYRQVFEALCWNVERQVRGWEGEDEMCKEEDVKVLRSIQRSVQLAHLDAVREWLKDGDVEGVVSRIRFLHLDYGVEGVLEGWYVQ